MVLFRLILSIVFIVTLTGCSAAKLSEEQCANIDWHALGEAEGESGQKLRNLTREAKACAKHAIELDPSIYTNGWKMGIQRYCVPETAYNLGRINKPFPNVCPDDLQIEFRSSYNRGLDNFVRVKTLKHQLKHLNRSIDKDNKKVRSLEKILVKHDANKLRSQIEQQQQLEKKLEQSGEYAKATKTKLNIYKLQDKLYINNAVEFHARTMIAALKKNIAKFIKLKTPLESELAQLK